MVNNFRLWYLHNFQRPAVTTVSAGRAVSRWSWGHHSQPCQPVRTGTLRVSWDQGDATPNPATQYKLECYGWVESKGPTGQYELGHYRWVEITWPCQSVETGTLRASWDQGDATPNPATQYELGIYGWVEISGMPLPTLSTSTNWDVTGVLRSNGRLSQPCQSVWTKTLQVSWDQGDATPNPANRDELWHCGWIESEGAPLHTTWTVLLGLNSVVVEGGCKR